MRQRDNLVHLRASHIQHMQKALRQMNLLLENVVSDITGLTGTDIIRAVITMAESKSSGVRQKIETTAVNVQRRKLQNHYRVIIGKNIFLLLNKPSHALRCLQ